MRYQKGYIALISVLIISAVVVLIVSSANLLSISEFEISLQESQSWETFYLANACAEEGLMKIKEDLGYDGDEVLTFFNGDCTILPGTGVGNQNRIVKVVGSAYNTIRRIKVEINRVNPIMEIGSWQEVADF